MELNQTLSTSPKLKFNLWLITTIVLAVLLIAGGVVFAWQKSANDKIKNDLQSQINTLQNQMQQLTKAALADATADWQTYRNGKYGYEIKYPQDWIVVKQDTNSIMFANAEDTARQAQAMAGEIKRVADIVVYDNKSGLSLEDWATNKYGKLEDLEQGKIDRIQVGDLQGIRYQYISMGMANDNLFLKGAFVFVVETTVPDENSDLPNIFNRMLATFKFTN